MNHEFVYFLITINPSQSQLTVTAHSAYEAYAFLVCFKSLFSPDLLVPLRASMDVVPRHISYDVNCHQCSYGSCCFYYYSSAADTHAVADPVNGKERGRVYLVPVVWYLWWM